MRPPTEDDLPKEEIERRRDMRGISPGIRIAFRGATFDVSEASRRSFFVSAADPQTYPVGELFDATLTTGPLQMSCRLEVMRQERDPRTGIVLRIAYIDEENEKKLIQLLGPLGGG